VPFKLGGVTLIEPSSTPGQLQGVTTGVGGVAGFDAPTLMVNGGMVLHPFPSIASII